MAASKGAKGAKAPPAKGGKASKDSKDGGETAATYSGPKYQPTCTDVFFLLLFIVFLIGMVVISIKATQLGDLDRLVRGVDMYGNKCGIKNNGKWKNTLDHSNRPVLVFPNPLRIGISYCHTHCPCTKDLPVCPVVNLQAVTFSQEEQDALLCIYDRDGQRRYALNSPVPTVLDMATNPSPFGSKKCYWWFETRKVLNRCLPTGTRFFVDPSANATNPQTSETSANSIDNMRDTSSKAMADINQTKYWILLCAGVALVLGFVWLLLLTCFAGFFVWTAILLLFCLLVAMTVFFGYKYKAARDEQKALEQQGRGDSFTTTEKAQKTTLMCLAVIFGVGTIIYFFMICFFFQRIKIAVRLIKEASHAILEMPLIILFPFVPLVLLIGVMFWFVIIWLFLGTVGEEIGDSEGNYKGLKTTRTLQNMQLYFVFGFFWCIAFILALTEMSFAFAFSRWYYAPKKKSGRATGVGSCTVWAGFVKVLFYHLGTVAFGSLIVAIIMFIRAMIYWLKKNLEKYRGNQFIQRILSCLGYCFACVQRFMEFINRNAYIITAMTGYLGFCGAAKKSFTLLTQNAFLLVAVSVVSEFLLILGKIFIVCISTGLAVWLFHKDSNLNYWALPVLLVAILAYAIASCFLSIFSMATATMFLCFCYDIEFATWMGHSAPFPHLSPELDEFLVKMKGPTPTVGADGKATFK